MNQLIAAFNGGEVSPLLAGRVDLPNMARACRIMRGFIAGVTGGAFRRPPLLNVGAAGLGGPSIPPVLGPRLLPFNYAAGISYVIEAGDRYLRFWNSDGSGSPPDLVAPWTEHQLDAIQFVQSNDVMWLTHSGKPVRELQHPSSGSWFLNPMPWKYPPLRDENLSATTIAGSVVSGGITLTASAPVFSSAHVGAFWEISHFRAALTSEIQVPIIPPASAVLTFTVIPTAGQTFTVGSTLYTWKAAADVTGANMVQIDTSGGTTILKVKNSRDNAINAILATGTGFGPGTVPNPDAEAVNGGDNDTSIAATGRLTGNGVNSDLIAGTPTAVTVGSQTYQWINASPTHAGDIRYGANYAASLGNLAKAVNLNGVAGTDYYSGMVVNADATAAVDGSSAINFTATATGATGNSVVTTTANGGNITFGAATLTGGVTAAAYKLKVSAKKLGDPGNLVAVSDTMTTDSWNSTTLTGGAYTNATSPEIKIKGQWDFTTYGRWEGNVYVEQKNAAGGWDILRQSVGRLDTNKTFSGIVEGTQILRVRVENMAGKAASDVPSPRFLLEAVESIVHGLVQVTAYLSPTSVLANTINELYSTDPTPNWREGAFSDYRGYPAAVCLHEQRLIFGGNLSEPQKLWASAVGDFRNFEETGLDDGSWQYQLATSEGNPIRWIVSQTGLIIGTAGDEWLMDGGNNGITPTSAQAKRQSAYGSQGVQPLISGSNAIFIERGGLIVREYVYDYQSLNYVAPDLTQLIDHLTQSGIRAIVQQRSPWSILWAVTTDGALLACTYARANEVVAWCPQPVDGIVQSVAVVYGQPGQADEVWVSVTRSGQRRIERFDPTHWRRQRSNDFTWHMDSAVSGLAVAGVLSGLGHLEGLTVGVMADGIEQAPQVVVAGTVTVADAGIIISGRVQPDSVLQPAIFDLPTNNGSSQGRTWHVPEASIRFYNTRQCNYSDGPARPKFSINFRDAVDPVESPPPLFTGIKNVSCQGNFNPSADLMLTSSGIQPTNVLAMVPKLMVYGT